MRIAWRELLLSVSNILNQRHERNRKKGKVKMKKPKVALVTGCAGFIGSHLCHRLLGGNWHVVGIDNLSRTGSDHNIQDILSKSEFIFKKIDICDRNGIIELLRSLPQLDAVFHLAAQVAVTTSYKDRVVDFDTNAVGSFNIIEFVKEFHPDAYCLYASTNKVYGNIQADKPVSKDAILNPYTPYGVSKSVGDLFFSEYARPEIGLSTCSMRQSCIYGTRQYGVEDQGWIAWFAIANLLGKPVKIFGNGKQVRDLLFIDDLVDLYMESYHKRLVGSYPVGGGERNSINLLSALDLIQKISGQPFVDISHDTTRPGDQPYFVADTSWTVQEGLEWQPKVSVVDGVNRMITWMKNNIKAIESLQK